MNFDRPLDFAANGYAHGVPMGGDLTKAPTGKAPHFIVYAQRDPDGPNLDRVQVIKGWLDKDGKSQEHSSTLPSRAVVRSARMAAA